MFLLDGLAHGPDALPNRGTLLIVRQLAQRIQHVFGNHNGAVLFGLSLFHVPMIPRGYRHGKGYVLPQKGLFG